MDLQEIYQSIQNKINKIQFSAIQKEFKPYPFILYTEKEYCLDNKTNLNHNLFYGNTAIFFENKWCAIWNIETERMVDMDILASSLIHEMYHCFQLEQKEERFPNDFYLLSLSCDKWLCNLRLQDSLLLVDGYLNPTVENLSKICYIRKEMLKQNIKVIEEFKGEAIEGAAEFASCMALKQLNQMKYSKRMNHYCHLLKSNNIQLNPRKRSYYSGCLLLLLLYKNSIYIPAISSITPCEKILDEISATPFHISNNNSLINLLNKNLNELKTKIEKYKKEFVPFKSHIVGYDPMNLEVYQNYLLIAYAILDDGKTRIAFHNPTLIEMEDENLKIVKGYYQALI